MLQPILPVRRCGIITNYRIILTTTGETRERSAEMLPRNESSSYVLTINREHISTIQLTQRTRVGYPRQPDAKIHVSPVEIRKYTNWQYFTDIVTMLLQRLFHTFHIHLNVHIAE